MRSLSLESIPANMNMKLLRLLVALFALSYANSDMTVKTFSELLHRLEHLEKHQFNELRITESIQTPRDVKDACKCKDFFAERLEHFLKTVKTVVPKGNYSNILENLQHFSHPGVNAKDHCKFAVHKPKTLTSDDLKKLIQDNIAFIQNWNSHCKKNHQ